jgi:hypothetical protein
VHSRVHAGACRLTSRDDEGLGDCCPKGEVRHVPWFSDEVVDAVVGVGGEVGGDVSPNHGDGACRWSHRQVQHGAKHEVAQVKLSWRKVMQVGVEA